MVGRAPYLNGPYNVPRTSGPAADWRLMPAVAYLLFASHPLSNRSSGRTDLPSAGWPSAGGPSGSWIGGPPFLPAAEAAQTECCSCSTAPVGLRESVGRRPPRRAHPGRTRTARIILAKICRLASLALPPAGRVVEPGGVPEPVRWADCTSRLGLRGTAADSGLQSVQTGGQAADPRQTGRQRGAGLQSVPAYTDITMDSVQCLTSPHENPFHFRLHFCIPAKQICQSWMQSGSRCGQ